MAAVSTTTSNTASTGFDIGTILSLANLWDPNGKKLKIIDPNEEVGQSFQAAQDRTANYAANQETGNVVDQQLARDRDRRSQVTGDDTARTAPRVFASASPGATQNWKLNGFVQRV
jgi:hypothetical protein